MNNYKQLKIWQKAIDLAEDVYKITSIFPKEETYGLKSQIQRSVMSIASNIAEGAGRNSNKEFKYFLSIANGSMNELSTQLTLSIRVGYVEEKKLIHVFKLLEELQKMNYTLIKKFSNL